jgi:acetyltransferase EpsM
VKLALVGYGALAHQIEGMITENAPASTTVCFDDNAHRLGRPGSFPFGAHTSDEFQDFCFYVCLGYKHLSLKQQIIDRLVELGREVPYFVHPNAYVHRSVTLGAGSMIYAGCTVDRNTTIGRGVLLNNGVVAAHDGSIGDCCWLGPGVTLSGHVTIGATSFLGSGSTVSNDVNIGPGAIVGLATAITKDVDAGVSVIGNPMKVLEHKLRLI